MIESGEQITLSALTPDRTAGVIAHTSANHIIAALILRVDKAIPIIDHILATNLSFAKSHSPSLLYNTLDFFSPLRVWIAGPPRDTPFFWGFFEHFFKMKNIFFKIFFVIFRPF